MLFSRSSRGDRSHRLRVDIPGSGLWSSMDRSSTLQLPHRYRKVSRSIWTLLGFRMMLTAPSQLCDLPLHDRLHDRRLRQVTSSCIRHLVTSLTSSLQVPTPPAPLEATASPATSSLVSLRCTPHHSTPTSVLALHWSGLRPSSPSSPPFSRSPCMLPSSCIAASWR